MRRRRPEEAAEEDFPADFGTYIDAKRRKCVLSFF